MNGTTTEYLTSGGEVVAQKTGANVTTYTRGGDGSLISMNRNGTIYYYQTNLQGDVEKILDASGTAVVSYTYDAFGRITSMTGDQTLGKENPFRYRSYFFDEESGLYYLQSRFYDPMMGRFISADSQLNEGELGKNAFTYSENNPVNKTDKDGNYAIALAGGAGMLFFAVIACLTAVASVIKVKERLKPQHTVYALEDNDRNYQYIGRTKNLEATRRRHRNNPDRGHLTLVPLKTDLNYYQARFEEQRLMLTYHTKNTLDKMNNQINGISPDKYVALYTEAKMAGVVIKGLGDLANNYLDNEMHNLDDYIK